MSNWIALQNTIVAWGGICIGYTLLSLCISSIIAAPLLCKIAKQPFPWKQMNYLGQFATILLMELIVSIHLVRFPASPQRIWNMQGILSFLILVFVAWGYIAICRQQKQQQQRG